MAADDSTSSAAETVSVIMTAKRTALDLVYWRNPVHSGLAFAVGLVGFVLSGIKGYSSVTLVAYALLLNLIARLVYRSGSAALVELNVIPNRAVPTVPDAFITAEEVQQLVPAVTEGVNALGCAAFKLLIAESNSFVLRWMVALYVVALLGRVFGTTGILFIVFVCAFTLPYGYKHKHKEVNEALVMAEATVQKLMVQAQDKFSEVLKGNKPAATKKNL